MKRSITYLILLCGMGFTALGQSKVIHYKELQKHLPQELLGYTAEGDPQGNMFEMNDMSYSSALQEYTKGESTLSITIMDYQGAASMYQASTMAWANGMSYEDDEQKAHGITIDNMNGWLSYNKVDQETQLIMGCKDRYLVTINITNNSNEDLAKDVFNALKLSDLP